MHVYLCVCVRVCVCACVRVCGCAGECLPTCYHCLTCLICHISYPLGQMSYSLYQSSWNAVHVCIQEGEPSWDAHFGRFPSPVDMLSKMLPIFLTFVFEKPLPYAFNRKNSTCNNEARLRMNIGDLVWQR